MLVFAENLNFDALSLGVNDTHEAGFISNGKYYTQLSSLFDDMKFNTQGISCQVSSIKNNNIAFNCLIKYKQ